MYIAFFVLLHLELTILGNIPEWLLPYISKQLVMDVQILPKIF